MHATAVLVFFFNVRVFKEIQASKQASKDKFE